MVVNQFSLWTEEQLDAVAPKGKTKREIESDLAREQNHAFLKKILERRVLSDEEAKRYDKPLDKKDLVNALKQHGEEWGEEFNPGIPQMLLETLSQYSKKPQKYLFVFDLVVMYRSIKSAFPSHTNIGEMQIKTFKYQNELSFFGVSQFNFMKRYLMLIGAES